MTSVECNRASGYLTVGFQPVVLVLLPALLVIGYSEWAGEENESSAFLAGARCQLWIFHLWTCRCLASRCFAFYKVWSLCHFHNTSSRFLPSTLLALLGAHSMYAYQRGNIFTSTRFFWVFTQLKAKVPTYRDILVPLYSWSISFRLFISSWCCKIPGFISTWSQPTIVHHRASLNLTVEQQSWIGSSPSFGGFVGSLVSGLTSKSLGARRGLLLSSLISCLGWLLIFLAAFLSVLGPIFPGVFLIGFSCGFSNPLTTVYVSETVGSGNKGVVTSLFNCQVTKSVDKEYLGKRMLRQANELYQLE